MAKHSPPGDSGFSESLVRHIGAAVALVAVVALAFWGIGQVRDDGSSMTVASNPVGSDAGEGGPTPTVVATVEPTTEPTTTEPGTTEPTSGTSPSDEGTAAPAAGATPTAEPAAEEPTSEPTEDAAATADGEVDPSTISIQVLDATGDGGATAADVADQLRGDGFTVVAENKAVREYEVTTVFYTPGNEAKAEQLAAMYGYDEVAPEPGNLSHSVDVHLVVGNDA